MVLSSELAKYIGNEMVKTSGKELAKSSAKSALSSLVPSVAAEAMTAPATKAGDAILSSLVPNMAIKNSGVGYDVAKGTVRHIPVEQSSSLSGIIPVKRKLYRGQQYSDTDFSYNSELMNEDPDKWGSSDVGKGYHFTPKKDMAGSWEGSDGGVIEIDYTPDQLLKAEDARRMIGEANKLLADDKYMAKLWQENEAMAEQIEKIADGNLEALAKREGKPFVQHLKANDDELGTIYYYKDVDPELTDRFVSEFKQKAEKYIPNKIQDLAYGDPYELFKSDIYAMEGKRPYDANVAGIGSGLENSLETTRKFVEKLKSEGYDGIVIKNTSYDSDTLGGKNDQYVVFDPEQIKDVNNLNPTTNPDINYSEIATANGGILDEKTNRAIEIINQANNFGSPVKNKLYDKIDPSTLPKGYSELSKLLDSASSSDNVIAKRVAEKIGTDSPLDADLDKVLDYLYVGDNREKRVFKQVLEDKIKKFEKDAKALGLDIDDPRDRMTKSEMYKLFGKAWDKAKQEEIDKIVQMSDGADIMNALMDTAHRGIRTGTAGGLDTALSERLGIAPGNTIKISSDRYGDYGNPQSAGRYNRYYKDIAINSKGRGIEGQVSTMAHERLHSFQNEARPDNLGRYSKEVSDAYLELQKDLAPFLKSKEEIAKRYGEDKADYWASDIEQEARMLQNYLDNTGITNDALSKTAKGEWGDEIKPAFDKFFNKLRALSKKGIALPAIAGIVGIGAMANKNDDKKLDNIK